MSASSKKKLRKAEQEANLTERQLKENKEAKKLKIQSIAFTVLIIAIAVIALVSVVWNLIDNLGLIPKWTTAVTIGEHKLNCVELNYYYRYAVSYFLQNSGNSVETAYALYGVNLYDPLDQQQYYEEDKMWSDYFIEQAIELAILDYTFADMANAEGYKLPTEEADSIATELLLIESNAEQDGYTMDEYVRKYYGNGADYETYKAFLYRNALAESYRLHKVENYPVPEDQITSYGSENYDKYSSFTYNYYSFSYSDFLTGGTTDDSGNTTYSDEENKAAEAAAKEAAELLAKATTVEEFDKAIANLSINKDKETAPTSTAQTDVLYDDVPENYREWIAEKDRVAGDTKIADKMTTTITDDVTTETASGYIVVLYGSRNDNEDKLDNVHQIFVPIENDEVTGERPSDTEIGAYFEVAEETANQILTHWKENGATKELFIELAAQESGDTEAVDGLYENLSRYDDFSSSEVFANKLRDWALEPERKLGDTEVLSSDWGYHILYYAGESEHSYRSMAVETELRSKLAEEWYNNVMAEAKANTKKGNVKPIDVSTPLYVRNTAS